MHVKFLMLPQTPSTPSFFPPLLPSPSLLLQIIGDYQHHQRSLNTLYLLSRTPAIQNLLTEMMSCLQLSQIPSGKGGKKEVISFLPQKTMNH